MRRLFLLMVLLLSKLFAIADEGMWLPLLIGQNYEAMQKMGLKLTAEELYSVNKSSMKDAIVHFGGGCTGEIISPEGLLLTNHHCGYDAIATLSSVAENYLQNGFSAKRRDLELPCKGLSVKFLNRIEDVTPQVLKALKKTTGEAWDKAFEKITKKLSEDLIKQGYEVDVKSFFAGNKYYMFVFEKYTDIRLVATPPESLGKYGGDTDNWMWPRHTCDFSMFRVYADQNNKPAAYSKTNRPYQAKHFLPISLKGINEGDFAMIFGYPGRTQRYLTSYGVDLAINESNPSIVKIRDRRLATMREEMNKDQAIDLKYASTYASIANYWKYFIGQTEQLKNHHVLEQKQDEEKVFARWAEDKGSLKDIFTEYNDAYNILKPVNKSIIYFREALNTAALTKIALGFEALQKAYEDKEKPEKIEEIKKMIAGSRKRNIDAMDFVTDKKLFANMNLLYYQDIPKEQHASVFGDIFSKYGSSDWQKTFNDYTENLYSTTALLDDKKFEELMKNISEENLTSDPAIAYALNIVKNYRTNFEPEQKRYGYKIQEINKKYLAGLMDKNVGKQMYPDANSTMRVTYGQVKAYNPKDAVSYSYVTLADGILEKYKPNDPEFHLQQYIVDLLKAKNFGQYVDKKAGTMITCFITNNDITGGNSGSPVINSNGELIGCAFDGNWEAMSGDIYFDQKFKRTICADIRYILWVLDKCLGGTQILEEMTIRK